MSCALVTGVQTCALPILLLDARATARRGDHLQIEIGALFQPLRLQQSSLGGKFLQSFRQFEANSLHRLLQRGPRRHMMAVGKNLHIIQCRDLPASQRSEEHTSELQSLMPISYAVFCLKKKNTHVTIYHLNSLIHNTETTTSS